MKIGARMKNGQIWTAARQHASEINIKKATAARQHSKPKRSYTRRSAADRLGGHASAMTIQLNNIVRLIVRDEIKSLMSRISR